MYWKIKQRNKYTDISFFFSPWGKNVINMEWGEVRKNPCSIDLELEASIWNAGLKLKEKYILKYI